MIAWVGTSLVFGLYVTEIADYGSIFGSLATVFVLLTYLYLSAASFLIGAEVDAPQLLDDLAIVAARLPTERVHGLQTQLPGLTSGEAAFETSFGGYQPVHGRFPVR